MTKVPFKKSLLLSALVLATMLIGACSSAPDYPNKPESFRYPSTETTNLGKIGGHLAQSHSGLSGHIILDKGREALNSRLSLVGLSEVSIDAQYYIWNNDKTGRILAGELLSAAERGVRVRLLLDDYGTSGKDKYISFLDSHENVEVRAYNPFNKGFRRGLRKWVNFALGFSRLNRRMHSKTFIVDNSAAITGGRNIGDEYFDANVLMNHRDRDVLSFGPVVDDISAQFDVMWNSEWSVPVALLMNQHFDRRETEQSYNNLLDKIKVDKKSVYPLPNSKSDKLHLLHTYLRSAIWAPSIFVYNPPAITAGDESNATVVAKSLIDSLSNSETEILVESAYFTLMDWALSPLSYQIQSGVKVKVLTNSLASTDVWTIHAGYTRNRKELLRSGLELYEWNRNGHSCESQIDNPSIDCASAIYSLHAKSVVFDEKIVFIGSFNLNPRSHMINTETGLIIESDELAHRIASDIRTNLKPENSWRLSIDDEDKLFWDGIVDDIPTTLDHEPQTNLWKRLKVKALSVLPLEKYW